MPHWRVKRKPRLLRLGLCNPEAKYQFSIIHIKGAAKGESQIFSLRGTPMADENNDIVQTDKDHMKIGGKELREKGKEII